MGTYRKKRGEIIVDGEQLEISNPQQAFDRGIGLVHQHFQLIDNFTISENILLGIEYTKSGFLEKQAARQDVRDLTRESGSSVGPFKTLIYPKVKK